MRKQWNKFKLALSQPNQTPIKSAPYTKYEYCIKRVHVRNIRVGGEQY